MNNNENQSIEDQLANADSAVKQQNWPLAISIYQQIYQENPSPDINLALVNTLFFANQFAKAERIADDYYQQYLFNQESFFMLISIYLANQSFIAAYKFAQLANDRNWQEQAIEQIQMAESVARNQFPQTFLSLSRQFRSIGLELFSKQEEILKQAESLPLKEYLAAVKFLLLDSNTPEIIRVTLIESLQNLKYDQPVEFIWIDQQQYKVVPSQLLEITEFSQYQVIMHHLDQALGDNLDLNRTLQSIQLQLILMYPFLDKVLIDPAAYIENELNQATGKPSVLEPEAQANYHLLINKITSNLQMDD